ncbi:T9SS type B sorting domain-containing protein [Flavivirga rizhaonensis]|uniref:T9SS type B sorting domain-containing protein n=1 Tax=Flavivirga rizhaonensis TaxID=2559571 RepID=A0A4S1E0M5_9FLAO|nr:T9SS type B sorting domain-containing protein [Flavivirga rizhaonensis]TGV04050.1 T9SS type B sorting domain-containing protein [Flavivirga rizhaonensis]
MFRKSIIYSLLFAVTFLNAQKETAIWYFGENAGLDFNSGVPVALSDGELTSLEGSATISDKDGNLLFYTDGITVWNRNHDVMPNGSGLKGHNSSTQSSIIIPLPQTSDIYYIFTNDGVSNGLQYNILDMSLDGGMGDIFSKNNPLENEVYEKLTAVLHANGNDVWIIAHKRNSNEFITYLLGEAGLNTIPVISAVGSISGIQGYMKTSPNGKLLAITNTAYYNNNNAKVELFRFDNTKGKISAPINIGSSLIHSTIRTPKGPYGLEFSSDSSKLYISTKALDTDGLTYYIYQFDVSNYNKNNILDSARIIAESKNIGLYALQIAIDNKIYVAQNETNYLAVIDNPNALGSLSNFRFNAINLGLGKAAFGLPPFIQSYFINEILAKNFCLGYSTKFSVNINGNNSKVFWDFGDGHTSTDIAPLHTYDRPGNYTVKVTATSNINAISNRKTLTKEITIYETPIANTISDSSFCYTENNKEFDLSTKNNDILGIQFESDYQISYHSSSLNAINAIELPVKYTEFSDEEIIYAKISNINNLDCYDITSFTLYSRLLQAPNVEDMYFLCPNNPSITINAGDFEGLSWQNSNGDIIGTNSSITITQPDTYTLSIFDTFDNNTICENITNFEVFPFDIIDNFDIEMSSFSSLITLTINTLSNQDFEYSLDGEVYQSSNIFEVGVGDHTIYIRDTSACKTITKAITAFGYKPFFTPNGDGINENWHIYEVQKYPGSKVFIYDRYGKLLKQLFPNNVGWDGRFNGKLLPNSDYWFRFENNGEIHTGHFALKR